MEQQSKKILVATVIISVVLSLAVGFYLGKYISIPIIKKIVNTTEPTRYKNIDFSLFWNVWDKLNQNYVDKSKLDPEKMLYGAIEGMVQSAGDPYTVFFQPTESKKFQEDISGFFGGVGIEIGIRNNVLTVVSPLKDTPASKAGLQAGDKILKIDTKSTAGLAVDEAVNLIRGARGTKVTLTILNNKNVSRDVTLVRDYIKVPTIDISFIEENGKKIAYLQIYSFNQTVDSEFENAAKEIINQNANGLIVDLRNNPGGLLDSAVNLSGWFLDKNQLVTAEVFGDGTKNDFKSDGNSLLKSIPTVVLINGGSASASEIMAGALHDNRSIKLIGEKTFGKGSVQELEKFSDGSSLKVTIAKWLTPSGISISEKGIEPDIKVEIPQTEIDNGNFILGEQTKDPQLDKAIDFLK